MAKKSVRKNLSNFSLSSDSAVLFLYKNGFIQSTIFHTIVLLFMALIVFEETSQKPVKIILSFASVADQQEVLLDRVVEIPTENTQDSRASTLEEQNNIDVLKTIASGKSESNIEVSLEENIFDESGPVTQELSLSDLNKEIIAVATTPKQTKKTRKFTSHTVSEINNTGMIGELSDLLSQGNNRPEQNIFGTPPPSNDNNLNDISRRLANAGAKTGDIQISIGWNTIDDIDLHVSFKTAFGEFYTISWMNRIVGNGMLDIDMNANPAQLTNKPIENIFWTKGSSPKGEFAVYVHNFRNWSGALATPVTIIVKIDDKQQTMNINARAGHPPAEITRFRR